MESCFGPAWQEKVAAYHFLNTLDDGDLFAIVSEQGRNTVKVLSLSDGEVDREICSDCALFQDPVTEIYVEIENEINVYFESGAAMLFTKREEQPWKLTAYVMPVDSGRYLEVSFFDGPLVWYSIVDDEKGEMARETLCGYAAFDLTLEALNAQDLPSTAEELIHSIASEEERMQVLQDSVDTGGGETVYATCELSMTQANIRIYAWDDVIVKRGGEFKRLGGFEITADGIENRRVMRHYRSDIDGFYGNTDICLDLDQKPHRIDVAFIWDDGCVEDRVSLSFDTK